MNDDSEGSAKLVAILGTALLTTIDILVVKDLFKKDSSIRNIGLVLSQWLRFTQGAGDDELCTGGENNWRYAVVRLADKNKFEITGTAGIEDLIKECREGDLVEEDDNSTATNTAIKGRRVADSWKPENDYNGEPEVRVWKEWDWKIEVNSLKHPDRYLTDQC